MIPHRYTFKARKYRLLLILVVLGGFQHAGQHGLQGQDMPDHLPQIRYHLTARTWAPLSISKEKYLDAIEGMVRIAYKFQDKRGPSSIRGSKGNISTPPPIMPLQWAHSSMKAAHLT